VELSYLSLKRDLLAISDILTRNMNFGALKPRLAVLCGLPIFFIIEAIEGFGGGRAFYEKIPVSIWTAIYAAMIFCIGIGLTTESAQFIYMVF